LTNSLQSFTTLTMEITATEAYFKSMLKVAKQADKDFAAYS
jgi:hypothetical protein